MLGLTKVDQNWRWVAYGKNPSARDYFNIGRNFPMADSFSCWIEKGYPAFAERNKSVQELYSWRFWARGSLKNELICGLLRDSNDFLGRPYPLLIIGSGSLPSWDEHWDCLPSACEKTWNQIEYISTLKFNNLQDMADEIQRIRPPEPDWSDCPTAIGCQADPDTISLSSGETNTTSGSDRPMNDEGVLFLDIANNSDIFKVICVMNQELKLNLPSTPNTVFIGGTSNHTFLVLFTRPMKPADFTALWSAASGNY